MPHFEHRCCVLLVCFLNKMEARPDVRARELVDEFFEKQDEPQYMRNVLSGLSGILLVREKGVVVRSRGPRPVTLPRR